MHVTVQNTNIAKAKQCKNGVSNIRDEEGKELEVARVIAVYLKKESTEKNKIM